jgi:hypothetical protein
MAPAARAGFANSFDLDIAVQASRYKRTGRSRATGGRRRLNRVALTVSMHHPPMVCLEVFLDALLPYSNLPRKTTYVRCAWHLSVAPRVRL